MYPNSPAVMVASIIAKPNVISLCKIFSKARKLKECQNLEREKFSRFRFYVQITSAARRKAGAPWSGPASTLVVKIMTKEVLSWGWERWWWCWGSSCRWGWSSRNAQKRTHQADELSSRPCCMNTTGPLPTILYKDTLTTWTVPQR